jgi:HlyD family secretion protein
LVAAAIVLIVAVPVGLKIARGAQPKEIETHAVALQAVSPSILASGTLAYQSEVKLVSEIIGRVTEMHVREGDKVTEGQLLLRLDPATARAAIAQLEAARQQSQLSIERQQVSLATQQAKWKRYEALRERGIVAADTFDEIVTQRDFAEVELKTSRAVLRQTEAQLSEARERLAKTEIRSPISGQVTNVSIELGETAVPSAMSIAGSDLMIVADTNGLYAEVNVDEADVARVSAGLPAKIVPAAFSSQSWHGAVEQVAVSPRQNAGQSKSYPVKIRLEAVPGMVFHPGMSCRAEISTRLESGELTLAVPVQAVRYEETPERDEMGKASVFVVKDGKVNRREVETGTADDVYIEITSGLNAGEVVAIGPAKTLRFLQQGERVAVQAASPASQPPQRPTPPATSGGP